MPQKPKIGPDAEPCEPVPLPEDTPADDLSERDYYYDDSHGYQTYKSDEDDDQFEDDK